MAPVTIASSRRGWHEVSTTAYWTARVLWDTGASLYAVVQDTGASPKVRVYKGNAYPNPSSWSEQDSGNNKTITNVDYPFDSYYDGSRYIHVAAFSATNTLTHYRFDTQTDAWTTAFGNGSTICDNTQPVRVTWQADNGMVRFFHTSSSDDTDLVMDRCTSGGVWTSNTTIRGLSDADASAYLDVPYDSGNFGHMVYQAASEDDVEWQTVTATNTFGSTVNLNTTGPAASTAFAAGARYTIYDDSGTDKFIAAFLTSTGILVEKEITGEAASNSIRAAAQVTIEGTATDVGARTAISTARLGTTPYCAWWDDASSGTLKYSTKTAGSWAAETNFATSITALIEIVPVGDGLAIVYQSSSDVVIDFIVTPTVSATGTVSSGTLTVSGQSITAQAGVVGTVNTGSLAVAGQAISGTVATPATGTVSSGTHAVTGQTVNATTGVVGAVGTGSLAVSGQSVAATTGVVGSIGTGSQSVVGQSVIGSATATGVVSTSTLIVAGQAVTATTGVVGSVGTGSHTVAGQTITGAATATGTIATGTHAVTGQAITATTGVVGSVATGSSFVSGQTVTGRTGVVAAIATGIYAVTGQTVGGTAGSAELAAINTGALSVAGQAITATTGTVASVGVGQLAVSGQSIAASVSLTGGIGSGSLSVSGQSISSSYGTVASITTGSIGVSGQQVSGYSGVVASVSAGSHTVSGQTITSTESFTGTISSGIVFVTGGTLLSTYGVTGEIASGLLSVSGQEIIATLSNPLTVGIGIEVDIYSRDLESDVFNPSDFDSPGRYSESRYDYAVYGSNA